MAKVSRPESQLFKIRCDFPLLFNVPLFAFALYVPTGVTDSSNGEIDIVLSNGRCEVTNFTGTTASSQAGDLIKITVYCLTGRNFELNEQKAVMSASFASWYLFGCVSRELESWLLDRWTLA
jgi:hypothetical protein